MNEELICAIKVAIDFRKRALLTAEGNDASILRTELQNLEDYLKEFGDLLKMVSLHLTEKDKIEQAIGFIKEGVRFQVVTTVTRSVAK